MKTCDNLYEKIVFFDDLSAAEREEIRKHVESCADCRKKLEEFQTITASVQHHQAEHIIDDELLERYSVYLAAPDEPDYDDRRLSAVEISAVKKHLSGCRRCQQKVERLSGEFREMESYLEETELAGLTLSAATREAASVKRAPSFLQKAIDAVKNFIALPAPRLYPIAAGTFAVLLVLAWFGPFFRSSDYPYYRLASLEREMFTTVTRSNGSEVLSRGLSAFQTQQYQQAIQELERFIAENPGDPNLFSAHYFSGIAYLNQSKSDFLGRFEKYDSGQLEKGIRHLQTAEHLTDNLGLIEDCYWYLGKALLMKKDGEKAMETFQKIVNFQGRRFREAQQMVRQIKKIRSER